MFGWAVVLDGPEVVVLDDDGRWQARFPRVVQGPSAGRRSGRSRDTWLERGVNSTISLPSAPECGRRQVDVFNGKRWALRRRTQNAEAVADGHVYVFWHDSARWTHVMRDGWSIARIHRSGRDDSEQTEGMTFGDLDVTDRLMVVLGQECIGPGRSGFAITAVHLVVRSVGRFVSDLRSGIASRDAGQNRLV